MKLSICISLLATSASVLVSPTQAFPLYIPAQYDILPDLFHAAKQSNHQSHQTHHDILKILPGDEQDQEKQQQHFSYSFEEEDDHSWIEAILESVFGKTNGLEKEMHTQRVQHIKQPASHRKDHHKSYDKELDDLAEILEADGVNIGVMIVS